MNGISSEHKIRNISVNGTNIDTNEDKAEVHAARDTRRCAHNNKRVFVYAYRVVKYSGDQRRDYTGAKDPASCTEPVVYCRR